VALRSSSDRFCEVRIVGQDPRMAEPWRQARIVQILSTACRHWSLHADRVPASLDWMDTPDGHVVVQPSELTIHKTAA
jgi:hypothetical protein